MSKADEDIIAEARKRFRRAQDYEAPARTLMVADVKFGNGDSDNNYQWPQLIFDARDKEGSPCLTVNKTQQHCLQIVNDMRQNKPGVQIRPVGGGATFDAAQVYEGVVRHIEYISNAQQAYDTAAWWQVFGGIGYWRIVTDYTDENSFDQDIYIRRIGDPRTVYLDPDIQEYDGSDAAWGFVFEDLSRDEAEEQGFVDKDESPVNAIDYDQDGWSDKDHVRVAEYFRRGKKSDLLIMLPDEIATALSLPIGTTFRKSEMPKEVMALLPKDIKSRPVADYEVEWFKIVGDKIVERKPWPGRYIPLIRCVGQETVLDGVMDRKGHVRCLKDPQRMYNYNTSGSVQYGALQSKTPWITPAAAIEGLETYWAKANTENFAYLAWKHLDENGNPIPKPERAQPPIAAPVFVEGMKVAQQEMMLASGQYQAIMGEPSNETSGKAINARQRQGDNATYHFIDHQASAIRFTGKQLIDLIPAVYDTPRIVQIIARDGQRMAIQVDPTAKVPFAPQQDKDDDNYDETKIAAIFNPQVGKYDVMADVGPSYATARQEAFNAFSQIISQNADLVHVVGDLMFKNADFPGADEIADRLRNMVPQAALGGESQEVQQLKQHMGQAAQAGQQQIEALHSALQKAQADLKERDARMDVEVYRAETDRIKALAATDPEAFKMVTRELVSTAMGGPVLPMMAAHAAAEQAMQPPEPVDGMGAQQPPGATNGQ